MLGAATGMYKATEFTEILSFSLDGLSTLCGYGLLHTCFATPEMLQICE